MIKFKLKKIKRLSSEYLPIEDEFLSLGFKPGIRFISPENKKVYTIRENIDNKMDIYEGANTDILVYTKEQYGEYLRYNGELSKIIKDE